MKKIVQTLKNTNNEHTYKTSNILNYENFPAWTMEEKIQIEQLCMTGTLQNSYYVSQEKSIDHAKNILEKAAKENPKYLSEMLIKGRNEGYIRSVPILGLTILSKYDIEEFKKIFNKIIKTGNDMEDFISMCRGIGRGFGRGIKKAMENWAYEKVNPFYAMKYTRQIGDMIRLSRFKTSDSIYDYILYHSSKGMAKNYEKSLIDYPILKLYEEAKIDLKNNDWKSANIKINEGKLDPMSLIGICNPPKDIWISLSKQMGVMMYLKELNKLYREDALDETILKEKITIENLKRAKIFPFRLFIAYKNCISPIAKDHLVEILDKYVESYNWEKWNKKIVIAPDISVSMTSIIKESSLAPNIISGMFSGLLYKGISNSIMLPWADSVSIYNYPRQDSIITHINRIVDCTGGGTYMYLPIDYMIENKIKTDIFIGITDSIEWSSESKGWNSEKKGWMISWKKYLREINKDAKAVLIRVDGYPTNPFDEKTAKENNIYQIFGWSDNVINYINYII